MCVPLSIGWNVEKKKIMKYTFIDIKFQKNSCFHQLRLQLLYGLIWKCQCVLGLQVKKKEAFGSTDIQIPIFIIYLFDLEINTSIFKIGVPERN